MTTPAIREEPSESEYLQPQLSRSDANAQVSLLKTGDYCDFVIICGQARHKVHKAIICPRSDFFKAACGSGFKVTLH